MGKRKASPQIPVVGLVAGVFTIYALGACGTVYVGDSGELVAAAATLGIPHPSGYPLYVLLGKLWMLAVPIGSIAFRMSLFSSACAAIACGGLYLLARRCELRPEAAWFAALVLAFSPSFWSQANIQRVYSLNALFVVAVCYAAVVWYQTRRPRTLVLAFFLAGLGACNHTFMGIVAIAVGVFAVISEPRLIRRIPTLAACAAAVLTGLMPYLYLPLRSRRDPRLDWGDPETLGRFLDVVLRRDFWNRAWLEAPGDFLAIAGDYLHSLGSELAWAGTALALVGGIVAWRRRQPVLLAFLIMAANLWVVGLHGSRSDIFIWHRYYIPSYVMAALLAAFGWQALSERWIVPPGAARRRRAVSAAVLAIPLVLLVVGYRHFDRSRYRLAEDFSRSLLATLPPGAHLAASDDNILFVLIYLHLVEGLRPDLDLILQGVGDAELPALRFDPDRDPLFFTHHPNWNMPGLEVVPVGLAFRTVRTTSPLPEPVIPTWELDGEDDPRVPRDYLTQNLIGHFHYMLGITFEIRDWRRARREFVKATEAAPSNDVLFYNLGLIYRRNGLLRRSLDAFERSEEINPRHIASNRPVRPADRVAELRREIDRLEAIEGRLSRHPELAELVPGSAAYHRRLAAFLDAEGERTAARGHRLLASESDVD